MVLATTVTSYVLSGVPCKQFVPATLFHAFEILLEFFDLYISAIVRVFTITVHPADAYVAPAALSLDTLDLYIYISF